MEYRVKVHLEGFLDPLESHLVPHNPRGRFETIFGTERPGRVRAEGMNLVVNHEEQYYAGKEPREGYDDPLIGYTVAFEDPMVGRRLAEMFREPREMRVTVSRDGREMRIN